MNAGVKKCLVTARIVLLAGLVGMMETERSMVEFYTKELANLVASTAVR